MTCFRVASRSRNLTVARWGNDVEDAARAGGIRTRVSTSSPRTFRPSSGIGIRAATPRSVRTLLSYGTRWRAASPMRASSAAGRGYDSSHLLDLFPGFDAIFSAKSTMHRRRRYISGQGDGSRTRSQGFTTPCADPLTLPPRNSPRTPTVTPSERFELPTPSFVARCSRSTELRRQMLRLPGTSHLLREVSAAPRARRRATQGPVWCAGGATEQRVRRAAGVA